MARSSRNPGPTAIRVAFCITELEVGGAERCLVELATRIDRQRFEPVVYVLGSPPSKDHRACQDALEAAHVEVHFLCGHGIRSTPRVLHRLTKLLVHQQPHLLQTFLFHANVLGRFAGRRAGVPRVVCGVRVAEREHRWHLALDRWTSRLVDQYVCVSHSVAEFSHRRGKLPREKLVVIPNGVETDRFRRATPANLRQLGVPDGQCAIVCVGRLDRQKRVDWLLRLAPELLARLPRHDLLLVGAGPQLDSLRRLAAQLHVERRVHFLGFRDDVPQILAAADLLVLPSAWEGMPNAVLEAMAAGLPVVSTEVEGVHELLGPVADPQTAANDSPEAFISKTVAILGNPQLLADLATENQRRSESLFTIEVMIRSYESVYENLLAKPYES